MKRIYLSHDAFAKRTEQDTIADQMAEVFRANGMPYPVPASKDPMGRATLLYDMMGPMDPQTKELKTPEIVIDPSCRKLIEVLPMVCRDADYPEFPLKFDGDDCFEGASHCLTHRMASHGMPMMERAMAELSKIADPTARWFATVAFKRKHKTSPVIQPVVKLPWEEMRP